MDSLTSLFSGLFSSDEAGDPQLEKSLSSTTCGNKEIKHSANKLIDDLYAKLFNPKKMCDTLDMSPLADAKDKLLTKRNYVDKHFIKQIVDSTDKNLMELIKRYRDLLTRENAIHCINMRNLKKSMSVYKGDIVKLDIGAIVNAANNVGLGCFAYGHKCIDNIIHARAGPELRLECYDKLGANGSISTGSCIITKGYGLLADHVIHAVGPVYDDKIHDDSCKLLEKCYNNVYDICKINNIKSVAVCCISTGVFHFPKDMASFIAIQTTADWLKKNHEYDLKVVFCTFLEEDYDLYKNHTIPDFE